MFARLRLAWNALTLYEEITRMDTSMLVKLAVAFLGGAVAAGSTAFLAGQPSSAALSVGLAAGVTTALAYLKRSPLAGPPTGSTDATREPGT